MPKFVIYSMERAENGDARIIAEATRTGNDAAKTAERDANLLREITGRDTWVEKED